MAKKKAQEEATVRKYWTVQIEGERIVELEPDSVIKKYLITAADGKNYDTNHYNLQMIIAVGFKVIGRLLDSKT